MSIPKGWLRDLDRVIDDIQPSIMKNVIALATELGGSGEHRREAKDGAQQKAAFKQFVRGDLVGTNKGGGILYTEDAEETRQRFHRYAHSIEELVASALRRPKLAWALYTPLGQLKRLMLSISGLAGEEFGLASVARELENIESSLNRYFSKVMPIQRFGVEEMARKLGRISPRGQYAETQQGDVRVTVGMVIDILVQAKGARNNTPQVNACKQELRFESEDFLGRLALSDGWEVTAGIHRSRDDTRHITVFVTGFPRQFHIRLMGNTLQAMQISDRAATADES